MLHSTVVVVPGTFFVRWILELGEEGRCYVVLLSVAVVAFFLSSLTVAAVGANIHDLAGWDVERLNCFGWGRSLFGAVLWQKKKTILHKTAAKCCVMCFWWWFALWPHSVLAVETVVGRDDGICALSWDDIVICWLVVSCWWQHSLYGGCRRAPLSASVICCR